METKYFRDYEKAKEWAEKHKLVECEYGDTGYMSGDQPISYCAWNKSGKREDEWTVEAWYTWRRSEENGRLRPYPLDKERLVNILGVEVD